MTDPRSPNPASIDEPHRTAGIGRDSSGASERARRADLYSPEQAAVDRVLVERIRTGQASGASREEFDDARIAMGHLVERFQDRIFAICLRMVGSGGGDVARDLAQDSLLRVLQGLDSYDGRSRLSTWIFRVTLNVCLSHLRSTKVRRHASLDAAMDAGLAASLIRGDDVRNPSGTSALSNREPGPDESVQHHEKHHQVARAFGTLDPDQRAVLVLRDVQGLDYEQMAAALEVAVGTVKSRLFRARLALRVAVEGLSGLE